MRERLSESLEDYLEVIAELMKETGVARVRDISERMEVSKPSVVGALRDLKNKDLITQEAYGYVALTDAGKEVAEDVGRRHSLLATFLTEHLHVDEKTAQEDACRMEHALSKKTYEKLAVFVRALKKQV